MESTCPSCKKKIEHEEYLFEVVCTGCSTRFNPFYDQFKGGEEETPAEAPAEPASFESTSAFQEIVSFGENLGETPPPEEKPRPAPAAKKKAAAAPSAETFSDTAGMMDSDAGISSTEGREVDAGNMLMTSGDTLHGYRVENYLSPQSVWAEMNGDAENPLEGAFNLLWERCVARGANGIVAIQWRFTPDGNRILVSGTPVRCAKE